MAGSLSEIKNKIVSTEKTSKITSAMRMVSSAKLVKSEQAAKDFQIYAAKIRQITTDLLKAELTRGSNNPMLQARPVRKTGYIVITSDKGLVGGYNSKILKAVMDIINEYHADTEDYAIISIGSVGSDFFKARKMNIAFELRGLEDQPSFDQVGRIISQSVEMYTNELFDELYVCYNHHVNSLTSQVRVQQMLPITELDADEAAEEGVRDFELEPDRNTILEQLLPQYTESLIYGAIVDAKTAEHAAGMTAMQTATDNAKNLIDDLTIQYNRARQAEITQEITEIVAGANALE
ncbi:F0F1 ATP synthase subunit gamma [Streptococcus chenjunshii]|uniref:ATP synthase gamma chain n=1 Tax=Streptococcus chenjunshii TaxID=2173853 RepID=A0A372KJT9_9STRE|nr:F0F1 ATP synthase subunit gamma [Streptococcus chenjunshii]AXQ78362.1 F0F1 ATP synthase subunit gamma [Streptococcus chenjunshii]RFU50325.1 F0F1 ATP synthase subunit gamma [Streptococcus chenjunshii]RFU52530.1 F0F1 ATP synthase subunit gamma [Streptococcus chenjunshii]